MSAAHRNAKTKLSCLPRKPNHLETLARIMSQK